ncbi:MAG TPA: hypothetical protein EYP56_15415 [Planctomycetaceae bacterium]|nr:hypothetical protein [Planctomycetaceae bacterium]
MNLQQAERDLWDRALLLGWRRRRRAVDYLARCPDPRAVDLLAAALAKGHKLSQQIHAILVALAPQRDQAKIDRLWQWWLKHRDGRVEQLLLELGQPARSGPARLPSHWKLGRPVQLKPEPRTVREALSYVDDTDEDIRRGALASIEGLPNDSQLNDEIFEAWRTGQLQQSHALETLIRQQDRKPARTELEALFYLVTGQVPAYQALGDETGEYFLQAFLLAPEPFRQRINQTVAESGSARLGEIYRRALAGREGFDRQLYLEALKKAGDEERLFAALGEMTLAEALPLCQRWAENGREPQEPRAREAVRRAVAAYRELGQITVESAPAPPDGLRDLFQVWDQQELSGQELTELQQAEDPLARAQAVYVGARRGPVGHDALQEAARSKDWPLRLVACLLDPALSPGEDHVRWIGAVGSDAHWLGARIAGTPQEYAQHSEQLGRLASSGGAVASRLAGLLQILCALQGAFVAGAITAVDAREATGRGAMVVEDAPLE